MEKVKEYSYSYLKILIACSWFCILIKTFNAVTDKKYQPLIDFDLVFFLPTFKFG